MSEFPVYLRNTLAGISAVGAVAVAARYRRAMRAARKALERYNSQLIETDCGPIEYVQIGAGRPVLVVHGDMGGFDQGLLAAKPLIDAGYQAIAVSRFGYLRSPMPEHLTVDKQADAYACLLDALGIRQAAVFAFSAGATSSIRFAARHPERVSELILQCPAAPGEIKVGSPPKIIFDTVMRWDFIFWAFITYNQPFGYRLIGVPPSFALTPAYAAEANEILASTLPLSERIDGFIYDTYDPQLEKEFYQETSEASPYPLSQIKTRVLVINAEDDPYANIDNVRQLAQKFSNAQLYITSDGGHPLFGHAQEIQKAIEQFLNSAVAI